MRHVLPGSPEVVAILEALGLLDSPVTNLTLRIGSGNDAATIEIKRYLDADELGRLAEVVKNHRLIIGEESCDCRKVNCGSCALACYFNDEPSSLFGFKKIDLSGGLTPADPVEDLGEVTPAMWDRLKARLRSLLVIPGS